jgi:hypothetical protein
MSNSANSFSLRCISPWVFYPLKNEHSTFRNSEERARAADLCVAFARRPQRKNRYQHCTPRPTSRLEVSTADSSLNRGESIRLPARSVPRTAAPPSPSSPVPLLPPSRPQLPRDYVTDRFSNWIQPARFCSPLMHRPHCLLQTRPFQSLPAISVGTMWVSGPLVHYTPS